MSDENHMQFCSIVREIARKRKRSLNRLFEEILEDEDGVGKHWLKERYYGRAKVRIADVDRVKVLLMDVNSEAKASIGKANDIQSAVNAFCKMCVGEDVACRTRTCELRAFSPYPYAKLTTSRFTEFDADQLGRES